MLCEAGVRRSRRRRGVFEMVYGTPLSKVLSVWTAALMFVSQSGAQMPELRRADPDHVPGFSISHINGEVWQAKVDNHGTAFLVTSEGIILADPIGPGMAEWLREEFDRRFGVPVRYVVYSHYHWDHASGGDVFADTARFVGHANMLMHLAMPPESTTLADVVGQYAPFAALDANGNGLVEQGEVPEDIQRFYGSSQTQFPGFDANGDGVLDGAELVRGPVSFVRPPDITYTDEIVIRLGGKRVKLTWLGDMNHSKDMSLIEFPDDDVLLVVDYISFGRLPNREMDFENGMFEEWLTAIRETEAVARGYEFVAPGHGPVGTWEDVRDWREYFEKLRDQVATGIAAGQTLEQMQQGITMDEYSDWQGFDWVDENVLGMFHFLTD